MTNPAASGHGCRILVVDDDPAILELVALRLEAAGYGVIKARDGERAIDVLSQTTPAAIVLDLSMPRVDGFQVLEHVRTNPRFASVPVLVLTARNTQHDVRRAISAGAMDFLAKPFSTGILLARVGRLLRQSKPRVASDTLLL